MDIKIDGKAVRELRKILPYPPYLIFIVIGAMFIFISLVSGNYFYQVWIFFLYSSAGMVWRYIAIDFLSWCKKNDKDDKIEEDLEWRRAEGIKMRSRQIITIIYHVGNVGLFLALFYYLGII